jgi:S1-C subfamily serine protease
VITAADGAPTETLDQLATALATPAETVVLTIVRGVETMAVTVSFAEPSETPAA